MTNQLRQTIDEIRQEQAAAQGEPLAPSRCICLDGRDYDCPDHGHRADPEFWARDARDPRHGGQAPVPGERCSDCPYNGTFCRRECHFPAGDGPLDRARKVYIAGPMRGLPEKNYPAFDRAADRLRAQGLDVVNPADLDREMDTTTEPSFGDYMRRDLRELVGCDLVMVLEGWRGSQGANIEVRTARDLGIPVVDDRFRSVQVADPLLDEEPPTETILEEAERLVGGDRNAAYGHPLDDFDSLGRAWGALLTRHLRMPVPDIPGEVVGLLMVALKLNREVHVPKRDNLTDAAGYLRCIERIQRRRKGEE